MSSYTRGRRLEYDAKRYFEERGYLVVRSAGSKSPVDLVCLRAGEPTLLVQCKYGQCRMSRAERNDLIALARRCRCVAVEYYQRPRQEPCITILYAPDA